MQALRDRLAVKAEDLRRKVDPATLPFQTTVEVAPVNATIGAATSGRGDRLRARRGREGFPSLRCRFARHRAREHRPGRPRKIEGLYDVCRARGLTGEQGLLVSTANLENLMLKEEVVEAARVGRFHVWGVSHIDEGIELMTGQAAGERAAGGTFREGTVHRLVDDRLREYADQARAFGRF
jgi:hypothetical protein